MTNHRKHLRIIAQRLRGGLSLLRIRLIVDHFRDDLCSEKAARCIALVDCEIDRLAHLDAESRGGRRQRTGDADANLLAGKISRQDGGRRRRASTAAKIAENLSILTSHMLFEGYHITRGSTGNGGLRLPESPDRVEANQL